MKRIKEEFIEKVETVVPLTGMRALEIGCGQGTRAVALAKKVWSLLACDPEPKVIEEAEKINPGPNISYRLASAEKLPLGAHAVDVAVFTLSLHHVVPNKITQAISEAIRVVKNGGWIIFLEPGSHGSFFETELLFGAGDGDERKAKALAYTSMLNEPRMKEVAEIWDETIFQFDSLQDFRENMKPSRETEQLKVFLEEHRYTLPAERRINIFRA